MNNDTFLQLWDNFVEFFRVDRGVKLGAFLLAILLWVYVVTANTYVYEMQVPLEVVNVPPGRTIAEQVPQKVKAEFRGTGITYFKTRLSLAYSDMALRLDVRRVDRAEQFYLPQYVRDHPDNFIIPRGLNLELVDVVSPERIEISLDKRAVKRVKVIPDITVEAVPGYTIVGDVFINPDSVILRGPASRIEQIDSVNTETVRIDNADNNVSGQATIRFPEPGLIHAAVQSVRYSAEIQPISERRITDIPILVQNVPSNLEVTTAPSTVSMTIEGGSSYIYELQPQDVEVYFDYAEDWTPTVNNYAPTVEMPKGVLRYRNMTPERVEVTVVRK
ncbi:MAG: hypothetical protein K9N46_06190 [Candidatus Marinimicrobia bacterium]|nr:hypothetical protein [Candidatus Neomarinimicrobiota bacterium]MCF7828568.1 hypothetical protein [Candidatus Neomarinimicrobiota bacterium]MCF7880309.1 hypothetical protein [Candidatus Neomarinimicrobiota bacterium]